MAVNARKAVSSKLARRAATVKLPISKDRPRRALERAVIPFGLAGLSSCLSPVLPP